MARPDLKTLDEITRRLSEALPEEVRAARDDLRGRFRGILETQLARLDLVTREEFEIQKRVLERSREKLEQLEQRLAELGDGTDPTGR
ncbi:MAG: accessory factor UbiK family protein [Wenzhouxiangellaceae bacterium]|nr:accessory factor UbiK family protein [Wenzhouxiangellaceae bacterium]